MQMSEIDSSMENTS